MTDQVAKKLKELPRTPGVYFHKASDGKVLYVGKAARLNSRVRQYFQTSRNRDAKTEALVAEIHDIDWIEVESEIDALFLEAEMVRRYMPPYNILLRDDKSLSFVRIDIKSDYPTVTLTRRPLDDGAEYVGPFMSNWTLKKALRYLRRVFPFAVKHDEGTMGSRLYEQLGLDPGINSGKTSLQAYRANLRQLIRYLRGDRVKIVKELEQSMKLAAKDGNFEQAARFRNQLFAIKDLSRQIIFSDREFLDISKDQGLSGLSELLNLAAPLKRIEGFDISHMQGTDTVASMVVFLRGIPSKADYRKFKMRIPGNDDFAHMFEVISRRLSDKNLKRWSLPDLFLIDGGKGQLRAALNARDVLSVSKPMIGLAKKEEEIVVAKSEITGSLELIVERAKNLGAFVRESDDFLLIELPKESHIVKLLQRIRDESHRFAVSYHSTLKRNRQTVSWLDEVPGIGPTTKKKLIRQFGSVRAVQQARQAELEQALGIKKAEILRQYIRAENKSRKLQNEQI